MSCVQTSLLLVMLAVIVMPASAALSAGSEPLPPLRVTESSSTVDVYDFVEVSIRLGKPVQGNPFTDVSVQAEFGQEGSVPVRVDGFCDSQDGTLYKVRFMPATPGQYQYAVALRRGEQEVSHSGAFTARRAWRRGLLRVDPKRPFHFVWEGTGEHYFWNGTTSYYLMGWQEDDQIRTSIDRLSALKVNRIRVLVYGRNQDQPWGQPVKSTRQFKLYLNPWVAERPDDVAQPGFDLRRFSVDYWQRYERMLRYARDKGMVVSVIPFIGGQVLPTPFEAYSEEEQLYYHYAVARLAAFCNVTWDLGNEHDLNRESPKWADWLGPLVKQWDPYDHLTSAHNRIYRTPGSNWNDMQLIQAWDAGKNSFLAEQRKQQAASGRIVPLVLEEYGYEDLWENQPGQRNADSRRRVAWEVYMAGCYQTTGETANRGTGSGPDSGGGWVNGRGDDQMTMLQGYAHIVEFFSSFQWWRMEPRNDLVEAPGMCLAEPGLVYAVYLPNPAQVTVKLDGSVSYRARWFNPRSGQWAALLDATGPQWTAPMPPGEGDWALLLTNYDWSGTGAYDKHEWSGFLIANNRWGGGNGPIWFREFPDRWSFWTEHEDDLEGGHVKSFPHAGIGWFWGDWAPNNALPVRLGELAVARSDWAVTLPTKQPGQSYVVYYQLYTSSVPDPKSDASQISGDLALIIYREDFAFEHWGKVLGEFDVGGRKMRVVHKSPAIGQSTYIIMIPTENVAVRNGDTIRVKDFDIKACIDFCLTQGHYNPTDYLITIQAGWESRALHGVLRSDELTLTVGRNGADPVRLPLDLGWQVP